MRPDRDKYYHLLTIVEYRSIVSGYVNAPTIRKYPINRMIVESLVKPIVQEDFKCGIEFFLDRLGQLPVSLFEVSMKRCLHSIRTSGV